MDELVKNYLEAQKAFDVARKALIEKMKETGQHKILLNVDEWLTFYQARVKDNILYHRKDESTGE